MTIRAAIVGTGFMGTVHARSIRTIGATLVAVVGSSAQKGKQAADGSRGGLPAGLPQGYHECFADFIAETYAAVRGARPDGLPTFADGLRAARITDAVIASADNDGAWEAIA
jgi:predicted dehydrogenase